MYMRMLLSRDDILKSNDLKYMDVEVPEWGGIVRICTMSGAARDKLELSVLDKKGRPLNLTNFRAKFLAMCLVDKKGVLLFQEKDVIALGKKSAKALNRVLNIAQKHNSMSDSDIDELAKN